MKELEAYKKAYEDMLIKQVRKDNHIRELADQLAAYKVAILAQEKAWCLALLPCDPKIICAVTGRAIQKRHPLVSAVIAEHEDTAAKMTIDAAHSENQD